MARRRTPTAAPDASDLLAEAGWLRSLALRLVQDEARADDVVQETWRRALEKPPRDRKALPAWLARVVRNTAAEEHRRTGRRRAREMRAARPESVPAVSDVVARTELHRRLVEALLTLDEPLRSTLLLRYFDDLTPKQIAARAGIPAATVRTRIKRGLDKLRQRLDDTHGGRRRAWLLPLVPWARDGGAGTAAMGTVLMGGTLAMTTSKQVGIGVGGALSLLVAGLLVLPGLLSEETRPEWDDPPLLESTGTADEPGLDGRQGAERETAPLVADATPRTLGPWGLRGTVRELNGPAIAGATVEATLARGGFADAIGTTHTDAQGKFEFDLPSLGGVPALLRAPASLVVRAWADGYAPSPEDRWNEALGKRTDLSGLTADLILEPGSVFRGRVLDTRGEPVPSVQVWLATDGQQERIVARSRADGSWRGRIPGPGRCTLRAAKPGFGSGRAPPLRAVAGQDVDVPDLVLQGEGTLLGVARFPDGTPAAHVRVNTGAALPQRFEDTEGLLRSTATADADGRFALRGLKRGRYALWPDGLQRTDAAPIYETGESAAALIVTQRRVLVEVRDPEGRPVPGTVVSGEWIHEDGSRDYATATLGRDGRHAFWAPQGERLLVSADVPGSTYAEAAIDVGETPWDRIVVLTLRPMSDATGQVRLRVTADDGEPVPDALVTLQTLVANSLLRSLYEVSPDADGLLPPVPVGTWAMGLRPGLAKSSMPIELYFPVTERVTVHANEVTEVAVIAERGGRIRLTLRKPTDGELTERQVAITVARQPDGEPQSLGAWVAPNARGWRTGSLYFDAPCIGRTLLRPGTYRLRVEAPGFETLEQELVVGAGEIVDVGADLEARTATAATGDPAKGPGGTEATDVDAVTLGQFKWDVAPLSEILTYVAKKLGAALKVTEAARSRVEGTQVTLQVDDMTARTLLQMMTAPHDLTWNAAGNVLWIGTADERLPPR